MSDTREVLIDCPADIRHVVGELNAALALERPLEVETVTSDRCSWEIAEGSADGTPLALMDATDFEFDDPALQGFTWNLEMHARWRLPESEAQRAARLDAQALAIMRLIGSALGVRCAALSNLQRLLGSYP